jgi:hypothetical protein
MKNSPSCKKQKRSCSTRNKGFSEWLRSVATLPADGKSQRNARAKVLILAPVESVLVFGRVPRGGRRPDPETDLPASRLPLLRRRKNLGKPWPTIRLGSVFLHVGGP